MLPQRLHEAETTLVHPFVHYFVKSERKKRVVLLQYLRKEHFNIPISE